ncbi:MAG: tetratricopeptide repeat protein [Candidatus Aminicenantaceae bacterium]
MKNMPQNGFRSVILLSLLSLIMTACVSFPQSAPAPPAPARSGPSASELYRQGLDLLKDFKYPEAKEAFDQVIAKDPGYTQAYYQRGKALMELKQPGQADSDFTRCLQLDAGYAYGYVGKAQVFMFNKEFGAAMQQVDKALSLDPGNSEAWYQKGNIHAYQKKWNPAIAAYKKCLEVQPDHAYAHYYLALAYNQVNRKDLTIDHLQKFLHLAPNAPEAAQVRKLLNQLQK